MLYQTRSRDPLYLEFLEKKKAGKRRSIEPKNGGLSMADFFEEVGSMGRAFTPRAGVIGRLKRKQPEKAA